jgi:hypothetical protein
VERLLHEPPPATHVEADHFALTAHHAYSALEPILERTARTLEGGVPQGPNWHLELLDNAFLDLPGLRPPVFSAETSPMLRELSGCRHLVRHAYDLEFDVDRFDAFLAALTEE